MDEKSAVRLLKRYAKGKKDLDAVLQHSKTVQKVALEIAKNVKKKKIDIEFLKIACILHDIGRFECPPEGCSARHGVVGASILKKEGLDSRYQRACSTHLGAGISKEEIKKRKLPIPLRNYIPRSAEEKILCYADKRVWYSRRVSFARVLERYRTQLGKDVAKKIQKLHDEIEELMER
jgi:uncharacterized protein